MFERSEFLPGPETSAERRGPAPAGKNSWGSVITSYSIHYTKLYDGEYRQWLETYRQDNAEALASVAEDLEAGDVDQAPVNWCVIAVKEDDGRLRVFLEAKSHPFVGEENLDSLHDLYRGKVFPP